MIVVDGEPKQRLHRQDSWSRVIMSPWTILIYFVVIPFSYHFGKVISNGAATTTGKSAVNSQSLLPVLPIANRYLQFEWFVSTTGSPSQPARKPPTFTSTIDPPSSLSTGRFTVARVKKPRNAFDAASICDKDNDYDDDYKQTHATLVEMYIQPALWIHPKPRVIAIYLAIAACPTTIRAILQQLAYASTYIETVYIFHQDHPDSLPVTAKELMLTHIRDSLAVLIDSNLTIHAGLSVSTFPPNVDGDSTNPQVQQDVKFDVVILWGHKPSSLGPNGSTVPFWSNHLDPKNGILVLPLSGQSYRRRIASLQTQLMVEPNSSGRHFAKVTDYEFYPPLSTHFIHMALAFKNRTTSAHCHLNPAEYMVRMHQRQIPSEALHVMDAATMTKLVAFSSQPSTRAYCEWKYGNDCDNKEVEHGLDPSRDNIPHSKFEIRASTLGPMVGRGVFLQMDAPQGTYLDLATSSQSIQASWTTLQLIFPSQAEQQEQSFFGIMGQPLHHYFDGYGFYDEPFGQVASFVDSGIMTFANHGCNSSYNIGRVLSVNEFTVAPGQQPPPQDFFLPYRQLVYDPLGERHALLNNVIVRSLRDVVAGEELFDNYMFFGGATYFHETVQALRDQCRGMAGEIETFQRVINSSRQSNNAASKSDANEDHDEEELISS